MRERILRFQKAAFFLYQLLFSCLLLDFFLTAFRRAPLSLPGILILGTCFLISYLVREAAASVWVLFLVHGGMASVIFLFGGGLIGQGERVGLICLTAGLFWMSAGYVSRGYTLKQPSDLPWGAWLLSLAAVLLGRYLKNPELIRISYLILLGLLILYLLILYADGLLRYLDSARDVTGVPVQKILSVNSLLVGAVLLIMLILVGFSDLIGLPEAAEKLLGLLEAVLQAVGGLLGIFFSFLSRLFDRKNSDSGSTEEQLSEIRREFGKASPAAVSLEFLLDIFLFLLAAFLLFRGSVAVIRFMLRKHAHESSDQVEEIRPSRDRGMQTFRERVKGPEKKTETMTERARAIYRARVRKYRKYYRPKANETAEDIQQAVTEVEESLRAGVDSGQKEEREKNGEKPFSVLTELYNEVRYGGRVPTREDLRKMKES